LLWEKNLGPSHPNVAMALGNLANIYAAEGKDGTAEELHLRALNIREASFGPSSLVVAESLFNLGTICTKQGKYSEAEPFFREALNIMEQHLNPNDPQIALALYGLANIYHIKAKNESSYNQVLEDRIGKMNQDNSLVPLEKSKNDIYHAQLAFRKEYIAGLYAKAEPLYQRAIKLLEQAYGIQYPSLKIMKDELAMIHNEKR
jgi:tetratricopeptide (TPR) repeat protein